jgi:hypothetical protein
MRADDAGKSRFAVPSAQPAASCWTRQPGRATSPPLWCQGKTACAWHLMHSDKTAAREWGEGGGRCRHTVHAQERPTSAPVAPKRSSVTCTLQVAISPSRISLPSSPCRGKLCHTRADAPVPGQAPHLRLTERVHGDAGNGAEKGVEISALAVRHPHLHITSSQAEQMSEALLTAHTVFSATSRAASSSTMRSYKLLAAGQRGRRQGVAMSAYHRAVRSAPNLRAVQLLHQVGIHVRQLHKRLRSIHH